MEEKHMKESALMIKSQFKFEGLMIERIIVHRIYSRTADKQLVKPMTSNKLIKLNQNALDALQMRITKALGNKSHGIEMSFVETGDNSFFQSATTMLHSNEIDFIETSKKLANDLNKAQFSTTAPGGLLTVIAGRVGNESIRFVATIKAEPQDGFKADEYDDYVDMEYISELLLTETQRLYKIGFLTEIVSQPPENGSYNVDNYRVFLFDHLMTSTETKAAAAYFYRTFLGMDIQKSSKKLTQDFFELTRNFIDTSSVSENEKLDLNEALRSELRSNDATLSIAEFAKKHISEELRPQYESFMQQKGFPQNSVIKDTNYIKAKLRRRRKYVFNNNVWIVTPPDKAEEYLHIEPRNEVGETLVRIKGQLQGQQ